MAQNTDLPDGLDFVAIPGDFHLVIICALVPLLRGPQFVSRSWHLQIAVDMCSASATDSGMTERPDKSGHCCAMRV